MELYIAESEIEPVIKAITARLKILVKKTEPDEEMYNLYRVLHRHYDTSHGETPIPEMITRKEIQNLLEKY